ncbi:HNH endonuclease [Dictyobacter kobayashii]|uniref:Restriction endonuclease n=1 Tax=Dictyobacter kobayashii TaxID=2014872 RepID=A0A402AEJ5_9CHLR|nr:HNH endonuclease [Dictyobacter kobayashii]GCE17538.1 restriction endonuclease [Dictyobacter kobayashii]
MDVVDLSRQDIAQQLIEITRRETPAPGKKQVKFNLLEVLLCYGLFYIIDPHRYGGRNMHLAPASLHTLAAFFKRSPGSLTNKMLNLDGSRPNSGKDEVRLFAQLSASPYVYYALYKEIMLTARQLSIDENRLPDFLDLLVEKTAEETLLLGQEELPASSGYLLKTEQHLVKEVAVNYGLGDELTEKLVEQRVRLTQHRFAMDVLSNCGRTCVFCGFEPRGLGERNGLLRASHIKPWSVSASVERMDVRNGLAACPIHDAGFDQGYLTVDEEYTIRRASVLLQSMLSDTGVEHYFGSNVQPRLLLPSQARKPDIEYLRYHQDRIFRG